MTTSFVPSRLLGAAFALVMGLGTILNGGAAPPQEPAPHALETLGFRPEPASAGKPGLDVLAWRAQFAELAAIEFREVQPGADLVLRGSGGAMEALIAFAPAASPSSLVLAVPRGLTIGVDGAAEGTHDGTPVRVMATFYQERGADLVRVAGGLLLSSDQLTFWAERSEKRAPLVVSLRVTFGAAAPIDSAVQSFGPGAPTLTATLLTDADSNSQVTPGDTLRYRLTIPNAGADIPNVVATIPLTVYHTTVPGTLNVSPFALDLADTTPEDVPLPLVLAGTDAEGQVLTYTIVTPPAHGALVPLTPGSANQTYTPAADYFGPDSFTYRVNDGRLDSNEDGTVTLTVTSRNDAPSFTKGADVTVLEGSGLYSEAGWATAMSAGPADEAGQTLTFAVTDNTNAALFSIAPAVASNGTLTFTPAADAFGSATITLTLADDGGTGNGGADTSAPQTFLITVTNINDAPSFTKGVDQTVLEDAGPQTAAGWATAISAGPNESSQTVTFAITGNTNAGLFSSGPAVSGVTGNLTYTPAPNAFGTATITLRLDDDGGVLNGGANQSATQMFVINVTAVNDAPIADDDTFNVSEGGTLNEPAPGVLAGDTDVEGSGLTAVLVSGPAHASSFTLNADGSFSYTNDGSEDTTDSFTYRANDGGLDSNVATVTITIGAVDDAPVAVDDSYGVNEGATLSIVAPGVLANDDDQEGSPLTSALISGPAHASSFTFNTDGGFSYTHDGSETLTDSFTYEANDGALDSNVATVTITITGVNDPPVAVDDAGTTNEDTVLNVPAAGVLTNDTDPDAGDTKTVVAVNGSGANVGTPITTAKGATLTLNANGSYTYDPIAVAAFQALDTGETDTDTFTYTMQDTAAVQSSATVTITITGVNDAPVVTTTGGASAFTEDGGAVVVDGGVTVTDVDVEPMTQATVTIANLLNAGLETLAAPTLLGGATANYVAPTLTISGSATLAQYQTMLQAVIYNNASQNPNPTARTIAFQVNDGTVGSNVANKTVSVAAVNDAPAITAGATILFTEGDAAKVIDNTITVGDVDDANIEAATVQITGNYASPQDVLGFVNAPPIFGTLNPAGDTLTLTGSATLAQYQAALRSVTYFNGSSNPSPLLRVVTWTVHDGTVPSNSANSTINVLPVNGAPVGGVDAWTTFGNTELVVDQAGPATPFVADTTTTGFGVLDNDSDPDGDLFSVVGIAIGGVPCADIVAPYVCATAGGGSVTMESNGKFTYTPQAGDTTADSFQYQLRDQPSGGGAVTVNVLVNLTLSERIWYVDGGVAGPGTGTSADPFNTFATIAAGDASDSDDADDYIFVHDSTVAGAGIALETGQKLFGEDHGLAINQNLNGNGNTVLVAPGNSPIFNATTGNALTILADTTNGNRLGIEIRGLTLSTSGANAIDVTSANTLSFGVTISDVTITGATAEGIDVNHGSSSITSTVSLSNVTVTSAGTGIDISESLGTLTITGFSGLTISGNTAGSGIVVTNATFDGAAGGAYTQVAGGATAVGDSVNPVGGAGVVLTNVAGDLAFTDLEIFSGNGSALLMTGTGAVNTGTGTGTRLTVAAGVAALQSTGGPVVDVTNATIDLPLGSATVTSSPTTGISLVSVSDGTTSAAFSAASGSIAGTAGVAFNVSDSNATISYSGAITKATDGRLVDFSNYDSDTATLSGNLSCTSLCDGIEVTNNGGAGTVTFSGGTKTLNTSAGAVTAVNLDTNTGGTVNFTVGGLDIDTSTATGFSVVGGGTVTVSGTGNAINTTTGTAFLNTGGDNINAAITINAPLTTTTGRLIDIQNRTATGAANVTLSGNLSTNGGTGILVNAVTGGTIAFSGTKTLNTAGNTAVTLTNNGGATVDFTGGGLDIDTTTGTGFSAAYATSGTVNVTGTGNSITSTGGQAISAGATAGGQTLTANITFDSVTSGGGLSNIELTRVNGTVTMNGGALSGATSQAVDIDTGTASITYAGTMNSTRGIFVANKTGGTVAFSGATKTLNTGTNAGVSLTSNTGATVNFTGGGLGVTTTSGAGFSATGGATAVNVTGTGNTISSGIGTALNVANTTIGASDLTFESISKNGAGTGIVLNNTGALGSLTVTGDAGSANNNSGGTIQNGTVGISLTDTRDVVLDQMNIHDMTQNGIDGFHVTNFTLTNSKVETTGTASIAGDYEVNAIAFMDRSGANDNTIDGIVTITGNTITNPERNAISIETWAGTIGNVNISNNTISGGTTNARIQDAVHVFAQGTTGGITTGTISNNAIADFRFFDTAPVIDIFIGGNGIRLVTDTNAVNPASTLGTTPSPFVISDNDIDNVGSNMIAVTAVGRTASANVRILNNGTVGDPMNNAEGLGISLFFGGNGTFNGLVHNNVIQNIDQGANPSGSSGIGVQSDFGGNTGANTDVTNSNITVTSNRVTNMAGNGIIATGINNAGTFNIRINDNLVTTIPDLVARFGIRVGHSNVGTQPAINLEMHGNDTAGGNPIIGPPDGLGIRQQTGFTFCIEGVSPSPANATQAATYVNGQNAGETTTVLAGNSFTNCSVPDSPTALMAVGGEAPSAVHADPLSTSSVAPVLLAARARWRAAGLTAEELRTLDAIAIEVTDLPGAMVGEARGSTIALDRTAAGWGWFVDPTPFDDGEFGEETPTGGAADRIDLLTTVAHEMLHVLGRADLDAALHPHDVMAGSLPRGVRRVPWFPNSAVGFRHGTAVETPPDGLAARCRPGEITRAAALEEDRWQSRFCPRFGS